MHSCPNCGQACSCGGDVDDVLLEEWAAIEACSHCEEYDGQDPEEDDDMPEERMMKWFAYAHLPEKLQATSMAFHDLAKLLITAIEPGPERTVALRKLLEAKDAAVRAKLHPGG